MFGYTADEAIGQNINIVIPSDRRGEEAIIMKKLTAGKRVDHFETTRLRKDGRLIDVSISISPVRSPAGAIVGASKIARDITEAKKAHEAVAESEQMSREIIATALDAFVQMDDVGRIREWNPQAEKIFGWSREEAMDKTLSDLIVPERHRVQHAEGLSKFLRTGEGTLLGKQFEIEATCKDGREIKVEVAITALHRRVGLLFNGFIRDLTEKTQAEEQLRRSQRMEAVGQLTGGIAHDFNNILTVITGTIEILAGRRRRPARAGRNRQADRRRRRPRRRAHAAICWPSRAGSLCNREKSIVNALIIETAKLLRPTLGEQIEIESMLRAMRLAGLGRSFSSDDGDCSISPSMRATRCRAAASSRSKPATSFSTTPTPRRNGDVTAGDYVMIAVSDTGAGIPAAIRDKVFEPFFTTKELGKGTGLGLSMVYGFVKQSGGHIKIYSEEGHGTTIKIYLPRASGADEVARDDNAADARSAAARDDPGGRGRRAGARLRRRAAAKPRLHARLPPATPAKRLRLSTAACAFDLLFTDVIMPGGMNGRNSSTNGETPRPGQSALHLGLYPERDRPPRPA